MGINRLSTLAILTVAIAFAAGCGKKDDHPNHDPQGAHPTNIAHVPTPSRCLQSNTSGYAHWDAYSHYGFRRYNWNNGYSQGGYPNGFSSQGFCGCGPGFQVVCDPNVGMVCMPIAPIQRQNYNLAWYSWSGGSYNQFGYYGYQPPQYGTTYSYGQRQVACHQNFAQTCDTRVNNCGYGYCRPIGNGWLGVCSR